MIWYTNGSDLRLRYDVVMTSGMPSLSYAERPPWRRRQAAKRTAVLLALLGLGVALWLFGPALWLRARIWHFSTACRDYRSDPKTIVCEEAASWAGVTPTFLSEAAVPTPLVELERLTGFPRPVRGGPLMFLHERTTLAGVRRVVAVRRLPAAQRQSWDAPIGVEVTLWQIPSLPFNDPQHTTHLQIDPFPRTFEADQSFTALRFFAGRIDPIDASQFMIDFETSDGRSTLFGRLVDGSSGQEPAVAWEVR